ncbi:hypothetical protein BASA50_007551 [Batrachochytrium salamandrivorans]|uniref:Clathrin/coatomer adaptor adaptin-like N-terminal domain-containing protein n=1 Tax=Batrachochytrium salamandrivorans TaxID=1357716 RepID=A0ABQ8F728_9FUNG|nr:hypothetical protein BASA61_010405 [Batrachochytrium salamandrivorans]KAH6581055.1 hypothetical protein BASA60_002615 [Batrachochytrium salamandrivorans]KAH6593343.1 hypothetical protein BASA50_007551 [Batrachochytrium salamandrivorans]KAH9277424.1 hypothetical protein BASA83_000298 [Batrachochytrium salamandrivorans]
MSTRRANARRSGLDPEFHELLVKLNKTNSESLRRNLIASAVQSLRLKMIAPSKSLAATSRFVVQAMFCEMMGHDTSDFAHLSAILLCQNARNIYEKRLAHLAASVFLPRNQKMSLLMSNTLQKDLCSTNYFEVSMALSVISITSTPDMVPLLIRFVEKSLQHDSELIRRKAVLAFHRFYILDSQAVLPYIKKLKRSLADAHPSVMSASLITLYDVVKNTPDLHMSLAPAVTHILNQIIDNKLDSSYNYHGVPAPFVQLNCMRMLAILKPLTEEREKDISNSVLAAMHKINIGQQDDIAYMLILQCVQTLAIRPSAPVIFKRLQQMGLQLTHSDLPNEKRLGIQCLVVLAKHGVQLSPSETEKLFSEFAYPDIEIPLKYSIIEAMIRLCKDAAMATTLLGMLFEMVACVSGNVFMQRTCIDHVLVLLEAHELDPLVTSKAILDCVECLPDASRSVLTSRVTGYITNGRVVSHVALTRALGWLGDTTHPPCLTWLAIWIVGQIGSQEALELIATLLKSTADLDTGAYTDLIAHAIETCTKLGSVMGSQLPIDLTQTITGLCGSSHMGIAVRAREYVEAYAPIPTSK